MAKISTNYSTKIPYLFKFDVGAFFKYITDSTIAYFKNFDKNISNFISGIRLQSYMFLAVLLLIVILTLIVHFKLKKADPLAKPKGALLIAETFVTTVDGFTKNSGSERSLQFSPYIAVVMIMLPFCFLSGLLGLPTAASTTSVTATFGLFSFGLIQYNCLKNNGFKGWFNGKFLAPVFFFLPINIIAFFAPALSFSLRIFGNSLSGGLIVDIVRQATAVLSIPIGSFHLNIIGILVSPPLHLYFDLFSAYVQTLVFLMLTIILVDMEGPEEDVQETQIQGGI
jgi:F-type H+-transporting ATPase subunit a